MVDIIEIDIAGYAEHNERVANRAHDVAVPSAIYPLDWLTGGMMETQRHHEELIREVGQQYRPILEGSTQGVYIYLDDTHKTCNQRLADLLGYNSSHEWASMMESFLDTFVDPNSQVDLATAYRNAVERYLGSALDITWKKKDGSKVKTQVILVPIVSQGHVFALHFVF